MCVLIRTDFCIDFKSGFWFFFLLVCFHSGRTWIRYSQPGCKFCSWTKRGAGTSSESEKIRLVFLIIKKVKVIYWMVQGLQGLPGVPGANGSPGQPGMSGPPGLPGLSVKVHKLNNNDVSVNNKQAVGDIQMRTFNMIELISVLLLCREILEIPVKKYVNQNFLWCLLNLFNLIMRLTWFKGFTWEAGCERRQRRDGERCKHTVTKLHD